MIMMNAQLEYHHKTINRLEYVDIFLQSWKS